MDISTIFWPLVEAIIVLPYDDLMRTRFFEIMHKCVESRQSFRLRLFDTYDLSYDDVNGLFYGTRAFIAENVPGAARELALMDAAIKKIENVITMQETCAAFSQLSCGNSLMRELDNLLAQLVI